MSRRLPTRVARRRRRLLWGVFFLLFGGGFAWLVFFSSLFSLKTLEIEGVTGERRELVRKQTAALVGEQRNIFLLRPTRLVLALAEELPWLYSARIKRDVINFPPRQKSDFFVNALRLSIQERQGLGTTCHAERCFIFDTEGVLFSAVTPATTSVVVLDERPIEYEMGRQVFEAGLVEHLAALLVNPPIKEIVARDIEISADELKVRTEEGWLLILSYERSFIEQWRAIKLVLEKEIRQRRGELAYVDLTIPNRVYFMFKD